MRVLDNIYDIVEWLAVPLIYFIIIAFLLLFVVRPFFAHLFDPQRIRAARAARELAEKEKERGIEEKDNESTTADNSAEDDGLDVSLRRKQSGGIRKDQQTIGEIADSDPEKAGELVKQWLKKET